MLKPLPDAAVGRASARAPLLMVVGAEAHTRIFPLRERYRLDLRTSDTMTERLKISDQVSWNSEAGHVSGTIIAIHTRDCDHQGIGIMRARKTHSTLEGFGILRHEDSTDLSDEERFVLDIPDIAEVWRRGSVISSWLLDLGATGFGGHIVGKEPIDLAPKRPASQGRSAAAGE
jgi:hypothetical protein